MRAEKLAGADAARHTRPDEPSEFPIPEFGAHDLVPPKNDTVWQPPSSPRA
jgi:NADH-quinone oxidoreductase subunit B